MSFAFILASFSLLQEVIHSSDHQTAIPFSFITIFMVSFSLFSFCVAQKITVKLGGMSEDAWWFVMGNKEINWVLEIWVFKVSD